MLGCACGEPFLADELYAEIITSAMYANLSRADFDDIIDFVATGGYALKTYERFARIKQDKQGKWRVANPRVRQSYRLNVGTIVEEAMLKVKLVRSRGGGSGHTGMARFLSGHPQELVMLFAYLVLGEHVELRDLLGIIPVALGIYLVTRPAALQRN